ncbi:MAG: hypothetical protein ABR543_05260 [Gemmatimonadaceae bacterium]
MTTKLFCPKVTARRVARFGFVALAVTLAVPSADAQRSSPQQDVILSGTPETPDYVRTKGGFNLFALGDIAATGMKMTGNFGWHATNIGPCSDGFVIGACGYVLKDGIFRFNWFEVHFSAALPPSEFRKIRSIYAGINAARGAGWTALYNYNLFSGIAEMGPADGQIGKLFSGAPSTDDGSCQDNTSGLNGFVSTGVSLLAGSTCPITFGPDGFQGPRPIADTVFINDFTADPDNYNFDFFKIAESRKDQDSFLGDFSTYGKYSDHYQDLLRSYGSVTPLGSGAPARQGYPPGLDVHFEAFQFGLPTISSAVFYNFIVVNNTQDVYGTGIDYDSLYIGLLTGFGGAQANAVYYIPSQGAVKAAQSGVRPGCNNAIVPAGVDLCSNIGFGGGAVGIVMLKSPIGDLRNKLFTKAGSKFFNPSNVNRGDTITFNNGHSCGFGGCWANTWNVNERRAFGLVSSTPENILDGRTPPELAAAEYWRIFKNKAFPVRDSRFNTYIPGNWDWNHDGVQDTLHYDTCDLQGCVATWADTMPGKQVNSQGNVGGVMMAGPVKLKAGDTTSFVISFLGAPDSASFESLVSNVIDAYQNFFLTPKPPTPPEIVAVEVQTGNSGNPQVQLYFTDSPSQFVDVFLLKFADDLDNSVDPSLVRLRTLNPTLSSQIRARAQSGQNFAELLIFKSCTDGATFTSDATCTNAPAIDQFGNPIGFGFQAYAVLTADENGRIPQTFIDPNVIGGRTYLYSLVTRSKGFATTVLDSIDDELVSRTFSLVDTIASPLKTDGTGSSRKVYVPISFAAGAGLATATFQPDLGGSNIPIGIRFTDSTVAGTFRLVFANRFQIRVVVDSVTNTVISTRVIAQDVIKPVTISGTPQPELVTKADTFTTPGVVQFTGAATSSVTVDSAGAPRFKITTFTVNGLGAVVLKGTAPLFVTTTLTEGATTPPGFIARSDFPGFILNINASVANAMAFRRTVKANGDTLRADIQNNFAVQYQGATTARLFGSGIYEFTFSSDAFGAGTPFTLGPTTVADVTASLAGRPAATTASTAASIAAILNPTTPPTLVAAKFPFTVQHRTAGGTVILAMVKRTTLTPARSNSILLGTGNDTLRVPIPEDIWVPGDEFHVLEIVTRDSTAGANLVIDPSTNRPFQVSDTVVTLLRAVLGCTNPRSSCNPLAINAPGATGYFPYASGDKHVVSFNTGFNLASDITFTATALTPTPVAFENGALTEVRVVPNPFVFLSQFDQVGGQRIGEARIKFTGMPANGSVRIYSVSGQFLQELSYTEADLRGTGDLEYNLRTREGTDLATGLYIYVVTAKDASGSTTQKRGKFVIIR